ncbi:GspH/FimT family pseudopilin [Glaciimonas sp. Gout2]|uniref:GspH/FimT family pseudopilin n=1 Tax=unclassified Glaciimonas TaxID=2644401 RepID=UPI002AB40E93|nr:MULTISPECIES: GspH/FimT family pseudopilin [unclassified Glaciimonas]MDY7547151.1 GspH/FimT family pseudopilin [Glaciimonas sp. CA11.2]MEB0011006.1 GspH/FimT family pseudopilin [Glaciimonas sp. Cout2]MEB0083263.1 GspH/FimT family pseudopilin [Glaciimonas sp. Gout2]
MAAANKGFTLVELMMTIVVFGILVAIALPSMRDFVDEQRVSTSVKEFIAANRLARSEAVKRGKRVTVCSSVNGDIGSNVCALKTNWSSGWLTMTNDSGGSGGEITARRGAYPKQLLVEATVTALHYQDTGRIETKTGVSPFFLFSVDHKFVHKVCISINGHVQIHRQNGEFIPAC